MINFHKDVLRIDVEKETEKISRFIQEQTFFLRRDGAIIGLSGGIDSAVCAELCVRALEKERVFGLILPEKESSPLSKEFALKQAKKMGIIYEVVDITPTLKAFGTYEKRDRIVKKIFPDYDSNCKLKLTLPPDLLTNDALNFYTLSIKNSEGEIKRARLKKDELNGIIAATNSKQRARMMHLYFYAEKKNFFVCGTTNRTEIIQGFFVKHGDGGVDVEPIAHLYKMQVYQLAEYLGVIDEILSRTPSPDTYSFEVSDEEFFYRLPYSRLDLLLYAWENNIPLHEVCQVMELKEEQVLRAFRDFKAKSNATRHLRMMPPSLL